jgi:transcription initiation factor TFIID TATA-box-binding protein
MFKLKKPSKRNTGPHNDDIVLPPYPPITRNVVCTGTVRRRVNMSQIYEITHGRFVKKQFPSCNLVSLNPKVACAIFGTGRFVVCGATSPMDALLTIHRYLRMIYVVTGCYLTLYDFSVENIVKSVGWGYHINLNLFHDDHQTTSVFNPSVFVGCQYMPTEPRPVGILFESGRAVITGCVYPGEAEKFIEDMAIQRYQKGKEYRQMQNQNKRKRDCDRPKKLKTIGKAKKKKKSVLVEVVSGS